MVPSDLLAPFTSPLPYALDLICQILVAFIPWRTSHTYLRKFSPDISIRPFPSRLYPPSADKTLALNLFFPTIPYPLILSPLASNRLTSPSFLFPCGTSREELVSADCHLLCHRPSRVRLPSVRGGLFLFVLYRAPCDGSFPGSYDYIRSFP